jgi:hypothetical protein
MLWAQVRALPSLWVVLALDRSGGHGAPRRNGGFVTTRTIEWASSPGCTRLDPATAGFWRSLLRPAYAWDVWDKVSARVRAGELGPAARLTPIARGRLFELRIYVADVSDKADVQRVRTTMRRALGFVRPIACYDWHGRRRWLDPGARETTPQEQWLALLRQVPGIEVYVWRPSDWDTIVDALGARS